MFWSAVGLPTGDQADPPQVFFTNVKSIVVTIDVPQGLLAVTL